MQAVMAMHLARDWGSDAGSDGNVMATQSGSVDVEDAAGAGRVGGAALKRQRRASGASQLGQQTDGLHQREASGEATAAAAPAASGDEGAAGQPRFELTSSVAASVEEVEERGRQVDEALNALEGLVLQQLDALKQAWQENIQGIRALIKNYASDAKTSLAQLSDEAQERAVRREMLRRATQFLGTNF